MGNHIKTVFLLTAMTGLFLVLGYALGGQTGMVIALIIALAMNFFSYWQSHTIVLKMYRAQPLERSQAPGLHDTVARLAQRAGLPMPRLYVIPEQAPNAFATAHMFIVNPLSGRRFAGLFSTHPPLEERIRRLTGAGPSNDAGPRESPGQKSSMTEQSRAFWDSLS